MARVDLYQVLGAPRSASTQEIVQAYRTQAKKFHPDLNPPEAKSMAEEQMKRINNAYEILGDPILRARYDSWLLQQAAARPSSTPAYTSDIPAYQIRLSDRTINTIKVLLLIVSVTLVALSTAVQPTPDQSASSPVFWLVFYAYFLFAVRKRMQQGILLHFVFIFVVIGAIIWLPILSSTSSVNNPSQNILTLMFSIWLAISLISVWAVLKNIKKVY